MSRRPQKALKALAVFVAFAIVQIYAQLSFAEPAGVRASVPFPQNIIVARLVTSNNQPITVNGASAVTGATILTGATIQTPADIGATINLGALGSVDMAPNTTIRLDFDENGNLKVTLILGCVLVKAKKKTEGEIITEQGQSGGKTDRNKGGVLEACFPPGATAPSVGQGVAAGAGATTATAGAGGGIGTAATIAIIAGIGSVAVGVPFAFRGDNPSPTNP
jgi:hypothetical protein